MLAKGRLMADVELREYIAEIEGMLTDEDNDQVIAHCRHVLGYFPKNLATYQLLGKALLEERRFDDAAAIFRRVLSATPYSFVAHIGMAIVGEEEGNLEQAIGHMERAFETRSDNAAVHSELKRLCGKRDGAEPSRIRLTEGALARLYLRGAHCSLAVDELRPALEENPDRIDLQVMLAERHEIPVIDFNLLVDAGYAWAVAGETGSESMAATTSPPRNLSKRPVWVMPG